MAISSKFLFFVGIDISKLTLDICVFQLLERRSQGKQFPNTPAGFAAFENWLIQSGADRSTTLLCSEHTGRYGEHFTRWASDHRWQQSLLNTTSLHKITPEHHRKTDQYDAQKLAEFGYRYWDVLRIHIPARREVAQLKRLQAERRKMVSQRASLKQKCKEAAYHDADMERLLTCWNQQIELLSAHIQCVDEVIAKLIKADPQLNKRYRQLQSAPGVGPVVGTYLLTVFAGHERLNPKQVTSRYGFAPHPYISGSSVRKKSRSARFGNPEMRRLMHQAALSVATHHPVYQHYYQRKIAEGKPHLLVINNIINKLIRLYCALWNNHQEYSPQYMQQKCNPDSICAA